MGGMADGPAPEDLWHLTIDDLLSSAPEPAPLGGPGPYVINLSASTAPISLPPKGLLDFDRLHVYQVQQRDNGQQRFRLRLGPIASELEADAILGIVREHYPRALTATADEDDLRAVASAEARNDRQPTRTAAPMPNAAAPAPPPAPAVPAVRAAPIPAQPAPAAAARSPPRPAPAVARVTAPPPAPAVRPDDTVSARELAEMFLATAEPVATAAPKVAPKSVGAPAPMAARPAATRPSAETSGAGAKVAPAVPPGLPPPSPVANGKVTPPAPSLAVKAIDAKPTTPSPERPPVAAAPTPSPASPASPPVVAAKPVPPAVPTLAAEQVGGIPKSSPPAAPAPPAKASDTSTVPVLGTADVASRRSIAKRAPAIAVVSRPDPVAVAPTLRFDAPVVPPARVELNATLVVSAPAPVGSPTPTPTPAALSPPLPPAISVPPPPVPPARVAREEPPRVSLKDFLAPVAPTARPTSAAPAVLTLMDEPPVVTPVAKAVPPLTLELEPVSPLALAPSAPRLPLVDLTLQPTPVSAAPANRPEPRKSVVAPTPPTVARPMDLLAELAASRPPSARTAPAASPPMMAPATGTSAAEARKPAPVVAAVPAPKPQPVRVEVREPAKPAVASAPVGPVTPAAAAPRMTPVDESGKRRSLGDAPALPVRSAPVPPVGPKWPAPVVAAPLKPAAVPAAAKARVAAPAKSAPKPAPALDRTQTVRALTPLELAESDSSRLFAIQLAIAESDFRPDEIPNLGIFEEYRLYSTMGLDGDKVLHALRLGFFTDEGAAQAVCGYLRSHFEGASLKRVSTAERDRFAEQRVKARKDAGATGIHAAIELRSPDLMPTTSLADLTQRASRRRSDEPRG